MKSPVPGYLDELLSSCSGVTGGSLADYIPQLAAADPDKAAVALATVDGGVHRAGDADHRFTMQSMSKPFAYALAIEDLGVDAVLEKVDVEPSGEAFNEISLDRITGRPRNPMINAGAIATRSLIRGEEGISASDRVVEFLSAAAGRELSVDQEVFEAEVETGHRNLALGHLLAAHGILDDPVAAFRGYVRQCAVEVTVSDIATMAATLANGGVQPVTGERIMAPRTARQVLSVMATCGMYDDSGAWLSTVGIPAKSGVSGGIIGVLPGQVGVATFSPRLDRHGNSERGVAMMRRLSREMGMHLMNPVRPSRSVIRAVRVEDDVTYYDLHGDVVFVSAESLIRQIVEEPPETERIVFDLSRVDEISDVGERMAREAKRRLDESGKQVEIVLPE